MFWKRQIIGTPAADRLEATRDGQALFGRGGDDRLATAFNRTVLDGGSGNDTLLTDVLIDRTDRRSADAIAVLSGGDGNDTLTGSLAARSEGDATAATVADGGAGADSIDLTAQVGTTGGGRLAAANLIRGGAGADVIAARATADFSGNLQAEDGSYIGLPASVSLSNVVFGGAGEDRILSQTSAMFFDRTDPFTSTYLNSVTADAGNDTVEVEVDANAGTVHRIKTLLDGGQGDDALAARITSSNDAARITAIAQIAGGAGNDSLSLQQSYVNGNVINLTTNLAGGSGNDLLDTYALSGANLRGSSQQWLSGGSGDDTLTSRTEFRGAGADGFTHSDHLSGGDGNDSLSASANVFAERGAFWPVEGPLDVSIHLSGGAGNDNLRASSGIRAKPESELSIRMFGGEGDDVLAAVYNGLGTIRNRLDGGAGNDRVTVDTRLTIVNDTDWTEREFSSGISRVDGGSGNDTVGGWGGTLVVSGGVGTDTFIFDPAIKDEMRITDFDPLTERIQFSIRQHADNAFDDPSESWDNADITNISDAGPGGDVIVSFESGARLILAGIGTGSIDDISGFVDYMMV